MLLSAMSVLVVAQSSSEIPEGLMNNPVEQVQPSALCARPLSSLHNYMVCRTIEALIEISIIFYLLSWSFIT